MGNTESFNVQVPGIGRVSGWIELMRRADGEVYLRLLRDARYVETGHPVVDEKHLDMVRTLTRSVQRSFVAMSDEKVEERQRSRGRD